MSLSTSTSRGPKVRTQGLLPAGDDGLHIAEVVVDDNTASQHGINVRDLAQRERASTERRTVRASTPLSWSLKGAVLNSGSDILQDADWRTSAC